MNQSKAVSDRESKRLEMTSGASSPVSDNRYQLHVCRGLQGNCPAAVWTDFSVVRTVEEVLGSSSWLRRVAEPPNGGVLRPHTRFKVALAACPNACTLPQIRDVGIIA